MLLRSKTRTNQAHPPQLKFSEDNLHSKDEESIYQDMKNIKDSQSRLMMGMVSERELLPQLDEDDEELEEVEEKRTCQENSSIISILAQIASNQVREQVNAQRIRAKFDEIYESQERIQAFLSSSIQSQEEVQVEDSEMETSTYLCVESFEAQAPPIIPLENSHLDHDEESTFGINRQELGYAPMDEDFFSDDEEKLDTMLEDPFPISCDPKFLLVEQQSGIMETLQNQDNDVFSGCVNDRALTSFEEKRTSQEMSYRLLKFLRELEEDDLHASPKVELESNGKEFDRDHSNFVENRMDESIEHPTREVDITPKVNPRRWAHMRGIGDVDLSIELDISVEDPFFPTLEQNKFQALQPFIEKSFGRGYSNSSMLKGEKFMKGLKIVNVVHRKLGGREFKWDLKRDKFV